METKLNYRQLQLNYETKLQANQVNTSINKKAARFSFFLFTLGYKTAKGSVVRGNVVKGSGNVSPYYFWIPCVVLKIKSVELFTGGLAVSRSLPALAGWTLASLGLGSSPGSEHVDLPPGKTV